MAASNGCPDKYEPEAQGPRNGTKLLTIEQQFSLRSIRDQIKSAPRRELEDLFIEVMRQKFAQENIFKDLMRQG